jgi:stearoyl-CoA desaturase (delta-9 desaturase)
MLKKVYLPALLVLLVYPPILGFFAYLYISNFGFGLYEALLIVFSYYMVNITIGVGLHRCWAHGAFVPNKVVEFILILLSCFALQGPILKWVSDHVRHHAYTDTDRDPHSPLKFGGGLKGFFWSHIGWMLTKSPLDIDRAAVKKFSRNKLVMMQFKYYWQIVLFFNTIVPFVIGVACTGTFVGGIAGFIFLGIGRAVQQHATFCINSMTHYFGTKDYDKNSTAGDIAWMAPFLLGENWHNFHHAFPSDYRNGPKWYHFDVHKWIIWTLAKLGLARDLKCTSDVRIIAQRKSVLHNSFKNISERWSDLQERFHSEGKLAINSVNKTTEGIKGYTSSAFKKYNKDLTDLSLRIKLLIDSEDLSKRLINEFSLLLSSFEYNLNKIEKEICSTRGIV